MKFRSTWNKSKPCSISEAIQQGLADDGGLFVPESWPIFRIDPGLVDLTFPSFAANVLRPFFESDPLAERLEAICAKAFDFPIPLRPLDKTTSVLELFHGPTHAFKDFGARFLALCLNEIPDASSKPRLVFVATSGDTGGAVAAAFHEFTKIPVVILYPKGKISPRQEQQLTVWGEQVQAYAVAGTFDDCQRMTKEAFASNWWNDRYQLISANSISLGRLLPQMVCFAFASLRYKNLNHIAPGIIVPSGNTGNAVAAIWAERLGFPIRKVILAHNANKAVYDYFHTGTWTARPTIATLANAMDVAAPSNFDRLLDLYPNLEDLKKIADAFTVNDDQIRETIKKEYASRQHIWCPHSAVGIRVRQMLPDPHWIVTATAHPAKFETILEPLLGLSIGVPANLNSLLSKPSHSQKIDADLASLQAVLITTK